MDETNFNLKKKEEKEHPIHHVSKRNHYLNMVHIYLIDVSIPFSKIPKKNLIKKKYGENMNHIRGAVNINREFDHCYPGMTHIVKIQSLGDNLDHFESIHVKNLY